MGNGNGQILFNVLTEMTETESLLFCCPGSTRANGNNWQTPVAIVQARKDDRVGRFQLFRGGAGGGARAGKV